MRGGVIGLFRGGRPGRKAQLRASRVLRLARPNVDGAHFRLVLIDQLLQPLLLPLARLGALPLRLLLRGGRGLLLLLSPLG